MLARAVLAVLMVSTIGCSNPTGSSEPDFTATTTFENGLAGWESHVVNVPTEGAPDDDGISSFRLVERFDRPGDTCAELKASAPTGIVRQWAQKRFELRPGHYEVEVAWETNLVRDESQYVEVSGATGRTPELDRDRLPGWLPVRGGLGSLLLDPPPSLHFERSFSVEVADDLWIGIGYGGGESGFYRLCVDNIRVEARRTSD